MKTTPEAVPLQLGAPRAKRTRGVFKAKAGSLAETERKFAAAEAAVRVAITGSDLTASDGEVVELAKYVGRIERALAAYVANVHLSAPKLLLAKVLETSPARVRSMCRFVEMWRGAPLIEAALAQVEAALPRAF